METAGTTSAPHQEDHNQTQTQCKRKLSRRTTTSFRLRCPSLNSLRLRRIFDIFDKNNDGIITVEELNQALNLLGLQADVKELELMVRSYTKPGNMGLQFEDFEALHRSLNDAFFGLEEEEEEEDYLVEAAEGEGKGKVVVNQSQAQAQGISEEDSDLSEAFKVFDEDGDGYISARELQIVLGKLGFSEGREMDRVEKMIISVDTNHDGLVDFFEFKDMMRSVIVRTA